MSRKMADELGSRLPSPGWASRRRLSAVNSLTVKTPRALEREQGSKLEATLTASAQQRVRRNRSIPVDESHYLARFLGRPAAP